MHKITSINMYYLKDTEKNTSDEKTTEVFGSSCASGSNPPQYHIYRQVLPNWNLLKDVTYVTLEIQNPK